MRDLFLEALKKICSTEGSPIRFPFNVSKVNDTMRGINPKYHISNTPFSRFAALITEMEKDGHCNSDRQFDSVVFTDSKYAPDLMRVPYTEDEKAAMKKAKEESMAAKRAEREAQKLKEENQGNGSIDGESVENNDGDSPSGEPIAAADRSRSRSRSRSRDRRSRRDDD